MKRAFIAIIVLLSLSSCVSTKKYKELDDKFIRLRSENVELQDKYDALANKNLKCTSDLDRIKTQYESMKTQFETLNKVYKIKEIAYNKLQASYDALSKNSSQTLAFEAGKSKKLLDELNKKQAELAKEQQELEVRSKRIQQLEDMIGQQNSKLNNLKESLSRALMGFEGQGLKVTRKNGKVYISMENKLLFDSGSWKVRQKGKNAINKIANILSINPDIEIMIEGHTDNIPYRGKSSIVDNWDLSVKRATSVVRQLTKNKNIDAKRIIAAGRSKYLPVADNTSSSGRAKNRRIEVILSPNLDDVMELLKN